MEREDRLSRILQKGVCGEPIKNGLCDRVRGECPFHAEPELRCASCLDADSTRRCSLRKENGSDYCSNHTAFPNFGKILKGYAEECRSKCVPFSSNAFREACYPNATELPPGNLHAIVGASLCLPAEVPSLKPEVQPTLEAASTLASTLASTPASTPTSTRPSKTPDAQAAKRALQRYKQEGGFFMKTAEGIDKGKTFPTLEEAVAYERQLTMQRRQSWPNLIRQSAQQVKAHVTTESDRVIQQVGQRVADELDRRLPAPTDDIERMREEKRRLETAIRKATENKKLERAAAKARAGLAHPPKRQRIPTQTSSEEAGVPCVP